MKINNKEYEVEELRLIKAELDKNPSILEEKKSRFFIPKEGDTCYLEDGDFKFMVISELCYKTASCGVYATREEALLARDRQQALVRLWNNADERYYFRPDWEYSYVDFEEHGSEDKYYIHYKIDADNIKYKFGTSCTQMSHVSFDLPYFKSEEDCKQFISENESDLYLYCLGVKK